MTSIYDDPGPSQPYPPAKPFADAPVSAEPYSPPFAQSTEPPPKKSGCGCLSCFLGCLGVTAVLAIVGGIATYFVVQKIPDFTRQTIAKGIEESDLKEEDKKMVMEQVDRLVDGYKQGKVDLDKLGQFAEEFVQSPLMDLLIAFGAKVKYIDNSGLSDEEKAEAERTLQRVARGVIEEKISEEKLDVALNHISNKLSGGQRQFKEEVSDEELRAFLAECKKLADEAMIPDEELQVDIGAELKKLVDKTLGEAPPDADPQAPRTDGETVPPQKPAEPALEKDTSTTTSDPAGPTTKE